MYVDIINLQLYEKRKHFLDFPTYPKNKGFSRKILERDIQIWAHMIRGYKLAGSSETLQKILRVVVNADTRTVIDTNSCLFYMKTWYTVPCYQNVQMIVELWNAANVKNIWQITSSWRHRSLEMGQILEITLFIPKFGTLYHFTEAVSNEVKVMKSW